METLIFEPVIRTYIEPIRTKNSLINTAYMKLIGINGDNQNNKIINTILSVKGSKIMPNLENIYMPGYNSLEAFNAANSKPDGRGIWEYGFDDVGGSGDIGGTGGPFQLINATPPEGPPPLGNNTANTMSYPKTIENNVLFGPIKSNIESGDYVHSLRFNSLPSGKLTIQPMPTTTETRSWILYKKYIWR